MISAGALTYSYAPDRVAVRDVTFEWAERQVVTIVGPNGSGKSTLLKLLARVIQPQSGTVLFRGREIRALDPRLYAREVGYLPQEIDLGLPMRAIEAVVTGRGSFLRRFELEDAADFMRAERILEECDALDLRDRYLHEMSGGERKRVLLARVLLSEPSLLLLDEPLAALDPSHVQHFTSMLRSLADDRGMTVVFVSHDLNWSASCADRMVVMSRGQIATDARPDAVLASPLLEEVFGFSIQTVDAGGRNWVVPKLR